MFSMRVKWFPLFNSKEEMDATLSIRQSTIVHTIYGNFLLLKSDEKYFVFDNRCPHQNQSLENCRVEKDQIICPFHQYRFSIENGRGHGMCINKHQIRITERGVEIGIEKFSIF